MAPDKIGMNKIRILSKKLNNFSVLTMGKDIWLIMDKAFVLLPQTLVKMWGINFKPDTKFYQFAYPIRFKNDGQIINAIYSLN